MVRCLCSSAANIEHGVSSQSVILWLTCQRDTYCADEAGFVNDGKTKNCVI